MGAFLIKGWCYFIYTCFWWLCYYYLTGCRSNSHFDYNTFSHCRWYSIPTSANMFLSIPRMAPRWLYMVMLFLLQLTQLSSQISYIYNENRTTFATFSRVTSPTLVLSEQHISDSLAVDTCTPRVPIFIHNIHILSNTYFPKAGCNPSNLPPWIRPCAIGLFVHL